VSSTQGRLSGHVSLVTGASSGIGAGVARALASEGAIVVAAARRVDRITQLAAEIARGGGAAVALELDVGMGNAALVADRVGEVARRYGRLDSVINAAGVMLSARTLQADVAEWQQMFDTNVLGLMTVTKAAFRIMREQRSGHVVNISSVSARLAHAGSPGYAATKSAVNTFSESLRKEGAALGIRVTVVSPGLVQTELFDHPADEATRARFRTMLDAITALTAADVAAAVVYALSQPRHVSVSEIVIRPTEEIE